ncbi:Ribose-phosphate pyrophosphokinase 1, chloroplastic [Dichanthelium oligosanthes]|uniref:ribose-phosphate diphosphokinase n=1 Tax=Dichanthelium oligosanthes TaxID=888268 RepID=A0A1E5W1Y6_9POAL|nr:Ribose-phosphate pyrophosphokinase 1, chloroplastic [Dichanthelium oligosanthes]
MPLCHSPTSAAAVAAHSGGLLRRSRPAPAVVRCKKIDSLRAINGAPPCIPVSDRSLLTPVTLPVFWDPNMRNDTRLRIFSGTANPSLSQEIASYLGLELGKINIKRFADGEIYVQLQESVRGCDVFLVQPTCPPANENLMELLIMIDACRRASAKNITAVIPYFGYARADRKSQGRESIAAKLVANMITEAGANRVLVCDLHSSQAMGYFDIPVDHVYGQVMNLIGDVRGKVAVMMDDMIDTAGTIAKGAELLHQEGAREVYACCTHAVFSPPAIERLSSGLFQEVIITNTIPLKGEKSFPQLTILSVANLLGETIWRVHDDCSVGHEPYSSLDID